MLAMQSEGLAKGPYQKNPLLAVRFEPASYIWQIWAFHQMIYPGLGTFSDDVGSERVYLTMRLAIADPYHSYQ